MSIRLAVHGGGRMARQLVSAARGRDDVNLCAVVSRTQSDWPVSLRCASLDACAGDIDLLIDFTLPGGTAAAADWCAQNGVALVSGTTGLGETDQAALDRAVAHVPVLWSPNLSKGVNLLLSLVGQAATALGPETPVAIHDHHHVHKLDAPSGTALALAMKAAVARGQELNEVLDLADGEQSESVRAGRVRCTSSRAGEAIGDHHVSLFLPGEEIRLSHLATDRSIYAHGAIEAGAWLIRQPAGRYTAADWLSQNCA